ncbi:NAD(P)-dependent dehydrogenase, short-chain alcohol dehydrogenase family [Thalictrum thalictroides]|uniref:NAD(P)-dependent dehydrogenase, short-chain alcohol dehydrogenase family n=1 Tax=Thalictrum thalictroides TaxID=46969 RepID=A0A7J6VTH8_THATH|nr:NAD(P)-dependent dehydrogenase, short-chain alcohol dehydrogenase family [Thalictrum thalictroides]
MLKEAKTSDARDPIAIPADLGFEENCKRVVEEIVNAFGRIDVLGSPSFLDYASTKGAIVAFTRGLALQLVNRGIRDNGVAPGPVWIPLIPASFSESEVPMKRAAHPHEIAPSYVFLACNVSASYFTGQVLHPNGGVIVNG